MSYPDRPGRDPSEFAAVNDHTEVVDTASIAESDEKWDEEGDEAGWGEEDTEEVAWRDDATNRWQVVNDTDPTQVMAPLECNPSVAEQVPDASHRVPLPAHQPAVPGGPPGGYGQLPYPQAPGGAGPGPWAPPASFPQGSGQPGKAAASSWGKGAWICAAAVLATLASLPFLLGATGTTLLGIALTAFGLVGAMTRWLERRRFLRGPRPSDGAAVIAMSPLLLLRSLLTTALAILVGGPVPSTPWGFLSYQRDGEAAWSWPLDVATAASVPREDYWLSDSSAAIVVWGLAAASLLIAWLMPFAADLRVGLATSLRALVPPLWGRALLTLGCAGFLAGAWIVLTGGLLH